MVAFVTLFVYCLQTVQIECNVKIEIDQSTEKQQKPYVRTQFSTHAWCTVLFDSISCDLFTFWIKSHRVSGTQIYVLKWKEVFCEVFFDPSRKIHVVWLHSNDFWLNVAMQLNSLCYWKTTMKINNKNSMKIKWKSAFDSFH